jgi:hypothetical protein
MFLVETGVKFNRDIYFHRTSEDFRVLLLIIIAIKLKRYTNLVIDSGKWNSNRSSE